MSIVANGCVIRSRGDVKLIPEDKRPDALEALKRQLSTAYGAGDGCQIGYLKVYLEDLQALMASSQQGAG